jgi:hypothetical protein
MGNKNIIRIEQWQCLICRKLYHSRDEAIKCANQKFEPSFKVGDIVTCGGKRFGWFDGDERWVLNYDSKKCRIEAIGKVSGHVLIDHRGEDWLQFVYVITAVDNCEYDPHRVRYHLFTRAMSGRQGHNAGHTYDEYHVKPVLLPNPPQYLKYSSRGLLRRKTETLL